jgi:hypothetical protein
MILKPFLKKWQHNGLIRSPARPLRRQAPALSPIPCLPPALPILSLPSRRLPAR